MKKFLIANIAALFFASSALATTSHAIGANTYADAGKTVYGAKSGAAVGNANTKTLVKLSTGVDFAGQFATTGYAIATAHKSGNKAYGTSFDSTAIFMKDIAQGGAVAAPGTADSADFVNSSNNWTTM